MNDQPTPPPTLVQKLQGERDAALLALSQAEGMLKANPPLGVSSMRWLDQRILDVRRMLALALDGSFIDALIAERAELSRLKLSPEIAPPLSASQMEAYVVAGSGGLEPLTFVHEPCSTVLCDVEYDDTLTVLHRVAASHESECRNPAP